MAQIRPCHFCYFENDERKYGALLQNGPISAHHHCLLFACGLPQRGDPDDHLLGFFPHDIIAELKRGCRLKCSFCKLKGATIGCFDPKCSVKFHFGCGQENGCLNIYKDDFRSYCSRHRPQQSRIPQSKATFSSTCLICFGSVITVFGPDVLYSPCCKKAWYHRSCLERMAYSAGLHFCRCPLCNDVDLFQQELLNFGINIPDRDALWELEPNAYSDLMDQRQACDSRLCVCPHGREHLQNKGDWNLVGCCFCGSNKAHAACISPLTKKTWMCDLCVDIQRRKTKGS